MNKSEVMSTSNSLMTLGFSRSESMELSWKKHKLINDLRNGVVRFEYKKSKGEIRFSVGTLRNDLFNYTYKGSTRKENPRIVVYWDYIRGEFRSFRIDNLLTVLN